MAHHAHTSRSISTGRPAVARVAGALYAYAWSWRFS
jgi:hypothetical protein